MAQRDIIYTANSITPTPKIWLRADKGINLSGTSVYQWDDQSGNNYNATQSNPVYYPTYTSSVKNGKPGLRFASSRLNISVDFYIRMLFTVIGWRGANPFQDYTGVINDPARYIILTNNSGTTFYHSTMFGSSGVYFNGVQTLDFAPIYSYKLYRGQTTENYSVTDLQIGYSTIAGTYWNGDILEIMVFDYNLTNDQTSSVESYLRLKYDLY